MNDLNSNTRPPGRGSYGEPSQGKGCPVCVLGEFAAGIARMQSPHPPALCSAQKRTLIYGRVTSFSRCPDLKYSLL